MLAKNTAKFERTYELSLHPEYPTNNPAKNTANDTFNMKYNEKSIEPLAANDAQK